MEHLVLYSSKYVKKCVVVTDEFFVVGFVVLASYIFLVWMNSSEYQ